MNIFVRKLSKIAAQKKCFFCWFCGPVSVRRLYNAMRPLYWDTSRLYNDMRRLYWNMRRLYNDMRRLYWDMRRLYMSLVLGYSWSTLLWHRCYYPHRSRDALSPVCGIFFVHLTKNIGWSQPMWGVLESVVEWASEGLLPRGYLL